MKRVIWTGVISVLLGILTALFIGKTFFTTYGFFSEYNLRTFAYCKLDEISLFWNIVWQRGKVLLLIFILSFTIFHKIMPYAIAVLSGFSLGILEVVCVMHMGSLGILIPICAWVPHGGFYLIVLIMLIRGKEYIGYEKRRKKLSFFLLGFGLVCLFLIGCFLETTLGTWVMQSIFQLKY